MFRVAILGCPNTGKSTLFNRLIRNHKAVIHSTAGVTRDYNEEIFQVNRQNVLIIDSPGWGHNDEFAQHVQERINIVLKVADLIVLLVEPTVSIGDRKFSAWLRKNTNLPVILVVNKCEQEKNTHEYELGWKHSIRISAKYEVGLGKLREEIAPYIKPKEERAFDSQLKISIIGRPNVGKSTFINNLLKENRVITSSIAGTTRDAITVHWRYQDTNITLIDTAGMRKKAKVKEEVESLSVGASVYSIRQANVVVLMLDAERGLEQQDLSVADLIIKEGKSLVIAINKSDKVDKKALADIKYYCMKKLLYNMLIITTSALQNKSCHQIVKGCIYAYQNANKRISTSQLNRWLSKMVKSHPPPLSHRKTIISLKFIAQIGNFPFKFKIIANIPEDIGKDYIRYLTNGLRDSFGLKGTGIQIDLVKNYNPYIQDK